MTQQEKQCIINLCKKYRIGVKRYTINYDGTVDVIGNVKLNNKALKQLPFKFGKVIGDFNCFENELTSLEGCPTHVYGDFYCGDNKLTSLEYSPVFVDGYYNCNNNCLTSLKGCTDEVFFFNCYSNQLKSLEHAPSRVTYFLCCDNKLTSIEHAPNILNDGWFDCYDNHQLPIEFQGLSMDEKKIFINYQKYFDIWTPSFVYDNMIVLIDEIKDGLE
jgi:hypothetical protein